MLIRVRARVGRFDGGTSPGAAEADDQDITRFVLMGTVRGCRRSASESLMMFTLSIRDGRFYFGAGVEGGGCDEPVLDLGTPRL